MPKGNPRVIPTSPQPAQFPSNTADIIWIGKGRLEEGGKTCYDAFERNGEKYQVDDFVHVKSATLKSSVILQITSLWEEETLKRNRNSSIKAFCMGNVFASRGSLEEPEILPSNDTITCELKDVESLCTVKNKEEIRNLKNFSQRPNHYCLTLSPQNDGQKREEPLLPEAPPKRARSESPNKLSNAKKRKLNSTKNGANRSSLSSLKVVEHKGEEDSSSDEERSYRRSLKRRVAFEQQERQANREQREKWEQQSINNKFFKSTIRGSNGRSEQVIMQQLQNLVEANLFSTRSVVPSELLVEKVVETVQPEEDVKPKIELATPGWKLVSDYEDFRDSQADNIFWRNYKLGLIKVEEEVKIKPIVKKEYKVANVKKIFDTTKWTDEEVLLFKELLCAFGPDWQKISNLMLSKQPLQLEEFYVNNRYDLTCELCGSTSDDEQLLLCDGCDRAYHTYCLNPPLKSVPKQAWYCTKQCEKLHQKRCELCKSLEDDQNMLLCDHCDMGFHIYCLNPPLKEIPKEEWCCESCKPLTKDTNHNSLANALKAMMTPEGMKQRLQRKVSKQLTKRAETILESLQSSLVYNDLKQLALHCLETPPTLIRESNLAHVDHISIFTNSITPPDVPDDKLGDHFDALLLAGELAVDKMLANPMLNAKALPVPLVQVETDAAKIETVVPILNGKSKKKKDDNNDGYGNGPRSWIFQANSGIYDIENSLKSLKRMTWFVKQHTQKIKAGDKVYIWVSGKDAGILAIATILSDPAEIPEEKGMKKYFLLARHFGSSQLRVHLNIDFLMPKRIEKSVLVNHSALSHLTILRQPIGTNFKLTKQESLAIEEIVESMFGKDISHSSLDDPRDLSAKKLIKKAKKVEKESPTKKRKIEEAGEQPKITCSICNSLDNADKILSCEGCDAHCHTFCLTPNLKNIPKRPWSCKKCTSIAAKACSICSSTEDDENMLLCDGCDEGFHLKCLDPPLIKVPKDEHWFCSNCKLTDSEVIACKLILAYKELHLEVRRLMQSACEDLCKKHRKNLMLASNAKKVLGQLQEIATCMTSIRTQLMETANACLQSWRENLLQLGAPEEEKQE